MTFEADEDYLILGTFSEMSMIGMRGKDLLVLSVDEMQINSYREKEIEREKQIELSEISAEVANESLSHSSQQDSHSVSSPNTKPLKMITVT